MQYFKLIYFSCSLSFDLACHKTSKQPCFLFLFFVSFLRLQSFSVLINSFCPVFSVMIVSRFPAQRRLPNMGGSRKRTHLIKSSGEMHAAGAVAHVEESYLVGKLGWIHLYSLPGPTWPRRVVKLLYLALFATVWFVMTQGQPTLRLWCFVAACVYSCIEGSFTYLTDGKAHTAVSQWWGNVLYGPILVEGYRLVIQQLCQRWQIEQGSATAAFLYISLFPLNIYCLEITLVRTPIICFLFSFCSSFLVLLCRLCCMFANHFTYYVSHIRPISYLLLLYLPRDTSSSGCTAETLRGSITHLMRCFTATSVCFTHHIGLEWGLLSFSSILLL